MYFYGVIYWLNESAFAGTAPAEVMNASARAIASAMAYVEKSSFEGGMPVLKTQSVQIVLI